MATGMGTAMGMDTMLSRQLSGRSDRRIHALHASHAAW
jgi:hypothetical protein